MTAASDFWSWIISVWVEERVPSLSCRSWSYLPCKDSISWSLNSKALLASVFAEAKAICDSSLISPFSLIYCASLDSSFWSSFCKPAVSSLRLMVRVSTWFFALCNSSFNWSICFKSWPFSSYKEAISSSKEAFIFSVASEMVLIFD